MADSFGKCLYRKCRAVLVHGFSELASNKKGFYLLDILTKRENEGVFRRRPVLKKAGSMIDLGTESSAEIQNSLREGLADFESEDPIEGEQLVLTYQDFIAEGSFVSVSSFSGTILAGPQAEVAVLISHSRNLTTRFEDLSTACVDKDKIVEDVTTKQWKPNVEGPRLDRPGPSCAGRTGGRALRVIHQIMASNLQVASCASDSIGAQVATVVPGAPGAGVSASRGGSNELNLTVGTKSKFPGKFMFASGQYALASTPQVNYSASLSMMHAIAGQSTTMTMTASMTMRAHEFGSSFFRSLLTTKGTATGMRSNCDSKTM